MSGTQNYPPQGYPPQQQPPQYPQQPPYQQQSPGVAPPPHQQQPAPQQPPPQPSPADKAAADKAKAEQRDAQQAGSIGAQVILDFNGQAGVAARGGAAPTIEENSALRDEHLIAVGLDPLSPSGPPLPPEALAAKKKAEEEAAKAAATPTHVSSQATKMSSLAAGIQDVPTPPPPTRSQGAQSGAATTVSVSKTV
jgi:hypothetical protein